MSITWKPRQPRMIDGVQHEHYASRIFINGIQIGDNNTYGDWFRNDEIAQTSTALFFGKEYPNAYVSVEVKMLKGYDVPECPEEKTLVIEITDKL